MQWGSISFLLNTPKDFIPSRLQDCKLLLNTTSKWLTSCKYFGSATASAIIITCITRSRITCIEDWMKCKKWNIIHQDKQKRDAWFPTALQINTAKTHASFKNMITSAFQWDVFQWLTLKIYAEARKTHSTAELYMHCWIWMQAGKFWQLNVDAECVDTACT